MLLDKADGPLAVRGDTIANCLDHPAFDVMESLRVLMPFHSAPRGCTPARFTPVIGISVAFFGLALVSRKVGVSQDLPDVFGPRAQGASITSTTTRPWPCAFQPATRAPRQLVARVNIEYQSIWGASHAHRPPNRRADHTDHNDQATHSSR